MSVYSEVYEKEFNVMKIDYSVDKYKTWFIIRELFFTTVINSFHYKGLPKYYNQCKHYVELLCFTRGLVCMFKDDEGEIRIGHCGANGILLGNGLYTEYNIFTLEGKYYRRKLDEIELLHNTYDDLPSIYPVMEYVFKATEALKAVDVSLARSMLGSILNCKDEQTKNKVIESITHVLENKIPFNVACGDWLNNALEHVNLYDDREYNITALWDIFIRYRNMFFTTYGINTVEIAKSERLTQAEGSSNDEIVDFTMFNDMYTQRKDWVERCNEHFGLSMQVEINRGVNTTTNMMLTSEEKIQMKNDMIAPYKAQEGKVVDKNVITEKKDTTGGEQE